MKQIVTSLGMIVFVGALIAGATGAFFSDTETSTGNVFTAGAIDLTVDSEQHYNGNECVLGDHDDNGETLDTYAWVGQAEYPIGPCDGTWTATNLGAQKFFNFDDVKPGDEGENTISLHVDSNDAYACVDISITANDDVSTVDPETDAGDAVEAASLFDGELAQNLTFFAWSDWGATPGFGDEESGEGDNIWQAGEPALFSNISGPASDVLDGESYTLADSNTGALEGNTTSYIGLAWCAGTIDATVPGVIDCDGATMGNIAQTDSMVADIAFRIEQARNNENFTCVTEEPPVGPIVVNANNLNGWFIRNFDDADASDDDTTTQSGTDGNFVNGPGTPPAGTGSFEQLTGTNGNDGQRLMTDLFNGMPLSNMLDIEYSSYVTDNGDAQATYVQVRIDRDANGSWDDALFFEPVYQNGTYGLIPAYATTPVPNQCGVIPNCVSLLTWQTWDAGVGGWWSNLDSAGGPPLTTLADYIAEYPTAVLATDVPAFRMQAGFGAPVWDNFQGNFDQLTVNGVTYNFEL